MHLWQKWFTRFGLALVGLFSVVHVLAGDKPGFSAPGPFSPSEERATFRVLPGFRVELVACEPEVIDPVALAFDENGRLFVAEMRGYPNDGAGTGRIASGRIRRLEDRDGDGFFERGTVFAEGLRLPTSVLPYRGGLLVADPPEIAWFADADDDGKADCRRTLYTGFGLSNIQQMINGLQWGLDNWVYGSAGSNGGDIRSAQKPDQPAVSLRGRGVRFRPDEPGSLEPTSGGGQFGLAADEGQQWFTATNSQHLRHIVLPDHYLRRNPSLVVGTVTIDIPDHGAACKVHRISPFEGWRVERTRRRKEGQEASRLPPTELVPGGFITSACGPVVYTADLFPERYRGNTFVCDPANNLIHRDVLQPHGATFIARRADADCEFLASTDNWFRPVFLTVGPEGAIYVADFYREAIEHPWSLPDDIKARMNLQSRGRGRIWRIIPEKARLAKAPNLREAPAEHLVCELVSGNSWRRLTAQRLLVERQDRDAVPALTKLARTAEYPPGRAHALWTLDGLKSLDESLIEGALKDPSAGVREQALRLADQRLAKSERLRQAVAALAGDPSPRVRFQLAFTLGEAPTPDGESLARIARRDVADPWTQTAILSSCHRGAVTLLEVLARDAQFVAQSGSHGQQLLTRLAALVGAGSSDADLARGLALLTTESAGARAGQAAVLDGLGKGLQFGQRSLRRLWEQPPPALKEAVAKARPFFVKAAAVAADEKRLTAERQAAVRLLGSGPFAVAGPALKELLSPANPADLQLAAVRALSAHEDAQVADILLEPWNTFSPSVRREAVEALFARPTRLGTLLDAIEQKKLSAGQVEPARQEQLRKHPDTKLRHRAAGLFARQVTADRRKVLDAYRPALEIKAEPTRGKAVFQKVCSTCHRLENVGVEVGPDLLATLRNKTRDQLLQDLLDPSREVDPRYVNYLVTSKAGRVYTGMITAETASSITLRRAEKAEDSVLRSQIDEIQATAKSVMPEGLEMQLSKRDVADLIAYLQTVGR